MMSVFMMTSVETIYQVTSDDTVPVNQPGAPRIEAQFNGFTQLSLQNPGQKTASREIAEYSFKQQQQYLNDSALAAAGIFNPAKTDNLRFRATVKLQAVMGQMEPFDSDSDSSGLAYSLSLALTWGHYKNLLSTTLASTTTDIPVFATGSVPVDGYIKPIGHLNKKIEHTCSYIEKQKDIDQFYIFIPQGNWEKLQKESVLIEKVKTLGGKIIALAHLYEALALLTNNNFDGGVFAGNQGQFAGLSSISYSNRHLFMGRDQLLNTLYQDTLLALKKRTVHNVTGISGSGKSSAVIAGLIPKLLKTENNTAIKIYDTWKVITPYQFNTFDNLLEELLDVFSSDKKTIQQWISQKHLPEKMVLAIRNSKSETLHNTDHNMLWVIDQYESIFTHPTITAKEAQHLFSILSLIRQHLPIHIITVLRIEYLSLLGNHISVDTQLPRHIPAKEISNIIALQLQYHRLQAESAHSEQSADKHKESLETRIQNDAVGKPLTSISYALQKMHQAMIQEDTSSLLLKHKHYEQAGTIDGVIIQQAELAISEVFDSKPLTYTEIEKTQAINAFFDAFIHMDTEGVISTNTLPNEDIKHYPQDVSSLINAFMAQGLIIDCGKGNIPKIKLAHDTLINQPIEADKWPRLQQWLNQHNKYLLWRNNIQLSFQHWKKNKKSSDYYLRDKKLIQQYQSFTQKNGIYNKEQHQFVTKSKASKSKQLFTVIAALIISSISASTIIWDQYFRIKIENFAFIGEMHGIPFGVTPLTATQTNKRQFHYQLSFKAGKLIQASRYNSAKRLKNDISRNSAALWKYSYTEHGDLHQVFSFSQNSKPVATSTYEFTPQKNKANVIFKTHSSNTQLGSIIYQPATFESHSKKKSEITQHRLEFNQKGFTIKRLFYNNHHQPVKDASGAYGLQYRYDKNGLIQRLEYLNRSGSTISVNNTYARIYKRDNFGQIISKSWVDQNDQLILNRNGFSQVIARYDTHGNLIERQLYENTHNPTLNKLGISIAKAEYDELGNQVSQQFFNKDGQPATHQWGFAKVRIQYDEYGNEIEWSYFDINNKPVLRNKQFAKIKFMYDQWGNRIEEKYYGIDDKPVLHTNGYFRYRTTYDINGNRLEESYFGINDEPILHKNGYARLTMQYDDKGNQIQRRYFDIKGEPTLNDLGYAGYDATFDIRNNRTSVSFFGTDQNLILNNYGFAQIKIKFDQRGNRTELAYYDKDNNLTMQAQGIAKVTFSHDESGNITETRYYDNHLKLTHFNNEFAIAKVEYDSRGNRIYESFFSKNNRAIIIKNGFHSRKILYDNRDNPTEWIYYNEKGVPAPNRNGVVYIKAEYDEKDQRTGMVYYDIDKEIINSKGSLSKRGLRPPSKDN